MLILNNITININLNNEISKFQEILKCFDLYNIIKNNSLINNNNILIFSNNFFDYQLIIINNKTVFIEKKNFSTINIFELIIVLYIIKYYFYKNKLKD
jgi:hypothetical protein